MRCDRSHLLHGPLRSKVQERVIDSWAKQWQKGRWKVARHLAEGGTMR